MESRAHHHAVQFYGNDQSLFTTVGRFIAEGLIAGQPGVIIATESHRRAILQQLKERLIDVPAARRLGDLVLLDADQTLSTFMAGGMPDGALFTKHVGELLTQTLRGREHTSVRAYGEMVDVLWKQGDADAAIRLEVLWNELASTHAFALLCGYSMGNFSKQAEHFQAVCEQHTHVLSPDQHVSYQSA
jgi:hypothetical protein